MLVTKGKWHMTLYHEKYKNKIDYIFLEKNLRFPFLYFFSIVLDLYFYEL